MRISAVRADPGYREDYERQKLPAPIPPEVLARCRKVKWSDGSFSYRVGKGRAGRYLDGKLHDAMPEVMR